MRLISKPAATRSQTTALTFGIITLMLLTLLTAGCILRDVTQVLYLRPDGSATWTILEQNVRSDAEEPSKRLSEEEAYRASRLEPVNQLVTSLELLGASDARTVWIRSERPFIVWSQGSFASVASLAQAVMNQLDVVGACRLELDNGSGRLEIRIDQAATVQLHQSDGASTETSAESAPDSGLGALEEMLIAERLTVRLTEGRFTEAVGFKLDDEAVEATPLEPDSEAWTSSTEPEAEPGEIVYRLAWHSG